MAPCRDEYFGNRLISFQKWFISVGWSVSHHDNSNKISKWIQCELPKFFFRPNEKCHCTNYKMKNYAVVVTTILVLNSAKKTKICQMAAETSNEPIWKKETILSAQMQCKMRYWTRKILFGDMIVSSRPKFLSSPAVSLPLPHPLRSLSPSQCINFSGLIRGVNFTKKCIFTSKFRVAFPLPSFI